MERSAPDRHVEPVAGRSSFHPDIWEMVDMLKLPTHNRYPYSAIEHRPAYHWPSEKRLAFYIALSVEQFAFMSGFGVDPHYGVAGRQTQRNYAWRDYGLRVGVWRLFDSLKSLGLPATVLMNSLACENYPEIVAKIVERGDDICGHGRTNAEFLLDVWEHDEARFIAEATEILTRTFKEHPGGWVGPGGVETRATPDLLVEAGYSYSLGWPVDDQPIWMKTRAGRILSVPYPMELNDLGTNVVRDHSGREFADMIVDQFDEMIEQSELQPLVMAVSLHPFVSGQPFRLRPVRKALKHCVTHPKAQKNVWFTTAGEIARYCADLPPGLIPEA